MSEDLHFEQSAHTREKILAYAARLFSAQGYENTSLAQVAREANVSKALIFWHFENKENLFREALGRTLEPYFINVDAIEGLEEAQQIERLIDLFYEFVRDNVYSVRFLMKLILKGERQPDNVIDRVNDLYRIFRTLMADIISRGRDRGVFRQDVDPQLEGSLILAALDGILIEHFMRDEFPNELPDLLRLLKTRLVTALRVKSPAE